MAGSSRRQSLHERRDRRHATCRDAASPSIFLIEHGRAAVKSIKKASQAASERSRVHATPYTLRHIGAVWAVESGRVTMPELA